MAKGLTRILFPSMVVVGMVAVCAGSSRALSPGETLFKTKEQIKELVGYIRELGKKH